LEPLDFAFQAGYPLRVAFLQHVPAYPSAAGRQGQSSERFHHAEQLRSIFRQSCLLTGSNSGKYYLPIGTSHETQVWVSY
jgi:hypothetical protein